MSSSSIPAVATGGVGLFLPPNLAGPNGSWAVSVVNDCGSLQTYAMQCTAGDSRSPLTCGENAPMITITEGMSDFTFATATATHGTTVSVSQTCTISSWTAASCEAHYETSANGRKTHNAVTTTWANADELIPHVYTVNFTAGARKLLSSGNNVCTSSASTPWPASSFAGGAVVALAVLAVLFL